MADEIFVVDDEFLSDLEETVAIEKIVEFGLVSRPRNTYNVKWWAVVATLFVLFIPIVGLTFPALAVHFPFFNSVFERTDIHQIPHFADMAGYAQQMSQSVTADGLTISLNESYFDGRQAYFTFLATSEQPLNQDLPWHDYYFYTEIQVIVDGVRLPIGVPDRRLQSPVMYWMDDYRFFFIVNIPLVAGPSPRLYEALSEAEAIQVHFTFENFGQRIGFLEMYPWTEIGILSAGSWQFETTLIRGDRRRIYLQERYFIEKYGITLHEVFITPSTVQMNYALSILNFYEGERYVYYEGLDISNRNQSVIVGIVWEIIDEFGTKLPVNERRQYHYGESVGWGSVNFDFVDETTRYLWLQPIIYEWDVFGGTVDTSNYRRLPQNRIKIDLQ